tara:strand:+ start:415 stop:582 length:168 start_codon:yes stop_codon:yes gene_type:complete
MDEEERKAFVEQARKDRDSAPKHSEETSRSLWRKWSTDVFTLDMFQEKDDKDKKS